MCNVVVTITMYLFGIFCLSWHSVKKSLHSLHAKIIRLYISAAFWLAFRWLLAMTDCVLYLRWCGLCVNSEMKYTSTNIAGFSEFCLRYCSDLMASWCLTGIVVGKLTDLVSSVVLMLVLLPNDVYIFSGLCATVHFVIPHARCSCLVSIFIYMYFMLKVLKTISCKDKQFTTKLVNI